MRLKLRNFRCHTNSQFELPDSGMVLLSGSSGSGKSTLLKAILYALFGNKAVRKPYTFGSTTCSVTLEWLGLRIHRSNRPNRLLVNEDLEDAAAQAYIDEKLGLGYEEFLISSYIPQKNNSSILSLAQTEQLSMIKTLALGGEQHTLHKEKLKEMLRESSTTLTEMSTEIQFTQREFDRVNDTVEPTAFPLQRAKRESKNAAIDTYRTRVQSYHKQLTALLERKAALQENLTSYRGANAELDVANDQLSDLKTQLAQLESRHGELQVLLKDMPQDIDNEMKTTAVAIEYLEQQKEYNKIQKQYKQIKTDEQKERQTRKTHLERKYEDPGPAAEELEEIQGQLRLWEQCCVAREALKKLQKELGRTENKEELIEHYTQVGVGLAKEKTDLYQQKEQLAIAAEKLAIEKTIVHCPKCKTSLRWQDKALVTVHNHQPVEKRDYHAELRTVENRIRKVSDATVKNEQTLQRIRSIIIPVVEDSPQQLKQRAHELSGMVTKNKQRKEELARLEREPAETPALKRMGFELKKKSSQLDKLHKQLDSVQLDDIDTLREKHRDLFEQVNKYQEHNSEMSRVTSEIKGLNQKVANCSSRAKILEQQVSGVDPAALEKKITTVERNLAATKIEQARDSELSERLDAYLAYREQKKELRRWRDELAQITRQVKKAELVHTARLTLKDNYTQAEILALETTISSINEHTRYYLDTFFAEHQLSAMLEAAKGKKIRTLKINTAIQYKGNDYDSINQLSGGEFDRCTLSSICGINSMLSSPILILDESLASLDTDTNTEIIRFLSELGQDKLVLVCSHEAVRGIFDEIIELH